MLFEETDTEESGNSESDLSSLEYDFPEWNSNLQAQKR